VPGMSLESVVDALWESAQMGNYPHRRSDYHQLRRQGINQRTRGETWNTIPGTEKDGMILIETVHTGRRYYVQQVDLDRDHISAIPLYGEATRGH
jgi:hypothetical protein